MILNDGTVFTTDGAIIFGSLDDTCNDHLYEKNKKLDSFFEKLLDYVELQNLQYEDDVSAIY